MFCRTEGTRILLPLICDFTNTTSTFSRSTVAAIATTAGVGLPQNFYPTVCEVVEEEDLLPPVIGLENLVHFIG